MKKQTVIPRKKRGPPATGKGEPVVVRMHPPMLDALDEWIAKRKRPFPSRPEAVRRLVEVALRAEMPREPTGKAGSRSRASELAAKQIEKMIDSSAPAEERDRRKHRLTKGPPEFRDDRVDLPKVRR